MSAPFSENDTPRKRSTFRVQSLNSLGEFSASQEYRIFELTDREFKSARQAVEYVRARIKANGGRCGYRAIDKRAGREGSGWAKELLGGEPRKWSFNMAMKLLGAVEECERGRALTALCEKNGASEQELRRRYSDWRAAAIASAAKKTGEIVGGVEVTLGGAIPVEFDDFITSQSDRETIQAIDGARHALLFRQVVASGTSSGEPYQCAMLYEPDAAFAIAATIARYLADKGMIYGAASERYEKVFPVLLELFGAINDEGQAFRERCRWAFWSHFRRWNPEAVMEIERKMSALNASVH
jgi:hypothetical protein